MEEDTPGSEAETEKKQRRLSEEEWAELIRDYEYGTSGVVELSDKFGISRQAIAKKFKEKNITRGSKREELERQKAQAAQKAQAVSERFAEKRAEWIEETRMQGYAAMKQAVGLINKRILEVYKVPGTPAASALDDLKALYLYQKSLRENYAFRLQDLLNADDVINEDDLPTLMIEDMTVEDVVAHFKEKGLIDEETDLDELREQVETTQAEVRSLA